MNNPLPTWLIPWLNRPAWQLLTAQWLLLVGLMLLVSMLLVRGEWQQNLRLQASRQQQEMQINQLHQQLAQLPTLGELERRLAQRVVEEADDADLAATLHQVGGMLLRWQYQEQPPQQTLKMQMGYGNLLRWLVRVPPALRISQLKLEAQATGLTADLVLQAARADAQVK